MDENTRGDDRNDPAAAPDGGGERPEAGTNEASAMTGAAHGGA